MTNVPENFWADLEDLADEPVPTGEEDRPLSYLDVEATGVITTPDRKLSLDRKILRLIRFEGEDGVLRDNHGGLISLIADRLDVSETKAFLFLKRMVASGMIEMTEAGMDRVYAVRLPRSRTPDVVHRTEEVQAETQPSIPSTPTPTQESLLSRFDLDVPNIDEDKLVRAVAETLWHRYEQAIQEVGRLAQLVEVLQQENHRLSR